MARAKTDLCLDISDIPKDGLELQLNLDPSQLNMEQAEFAVVDFISLQARVIKPGKEIVLQGQISSALELICSRCLDTFSLPFTSPFTLTYHPWERSKEGEEDEELEESDLDAVYYVGEQVDLRPAIQEQVILSVPLKPLCFVDCQGLCPRCGRNLNLSRCACQTSEVDERLLILKKLRKGPARNEA